jgi:spoIIIJ-associated protein
MPTAHHEEQPNMEHHEPHDRHESNAPSPEAPAVSNDELLELGRKTTEGLFQAMGFDARVTARAEEAGSVEVTAQVSQGEELLTGRKGEVRQALQHLLNRMINRGEGSRYHLQLEINEFWLHREAELTELARALAEEALQSGAERHTEYLNAQERRVVHVTLKDDPRVKTYAIGDGLIKKVAVAPADAPEPAADE